MKISAMICKVIGVGLPAQASLYRNPELIKEAPMYPKLKMIIEKAATPTGPGLNEKLRALGRELDSRLGDPRPMPGINTKRFTKPQGESGNR